MAAPNSPERSRKDRLVYFVLGFGTMLIIGVVSAFIFGTSNPIILTITNFILPVLGGAAALLPVIASPGGPSGQTTPTSTNRQPEEPERLIEYPHRKKPRISNRIVYSVLGVLLVFSLTLNVVLGKGILHPGGPQPTTTSLSGSTPSPSATPGHNDADSSFIPPGQSPVIDDALQNNSKGYGWTTGSSSSGSCIFVQGQYLLLTAPAGLMNGVECNTSSSGSIFSNFVYQIRMTILLGMDDRNNSGTGPTFRVNTAGAVQEYHVSFDVEGDWLVLVNANPATGSPLCANPCPYFHTGLNQPNYITILAAGSSIQVQINGYPLGAYTDHNYTSGFLGAELDPGNDNGSVAFSNMRVWQLPANS